MSSDSIYDPIAEALGLTPMHFDYKVEPEHAERPNTGELNAFYGLKHTEESLKKMRGPRPHFSGKNNHFYGKDHSPEAKKKIIEANKGRKWPKEVNAKKGTPGYLQKQSKSVVIDGVSYPTIADANRKTGIGKHSIRKYYLQTR